MIETLKEPQPLLDCSNCSFIKQPVKIHRKTVISFYVESLLLNKLDELAKANGVSRSQLVSYALKQFLKEVEKE